MISCPLFHQDKTYIQFTLHQNLRDMLVSYFQEIIAEKSEMRVIYVFSMVLENPGMFDLNLIVDVVKALYKIKPGNVKKFLFKIRKFFIINSLISLLVKFR